VKLVGKLTEGELCTPKALLLCFPADPEVGVKADRNRWLAALKELCHDAGKAVGEGSRAAAGTQSLRPHSSALMSPLVEAQILEDGKAIDARMGEASGVGVDVKAARRHKQWRQLLDNLARIVDGVRGVGAPSLAVGRPAERLDSPERAATMYFKLGEAQALMGPHPWGPTIGTLPGGTSS